MSDTEKLLAERATTHGEYSEHARITQGIMDIIMSGRNWPRLSVIQRESLHMFAHKIGRICEGDPNHKDHWEDISGYSVLVSQRLGPQPGPVPVLAVGDQKPMLTGNPEAHDYAGEIYRDAETRPVPLEDSNRHADRVPLPAVLNRKEYNLLPIHQRIHYKWEVMTGVWVLT